MFNMTDIKIRTAQNTILLQNKASLGERMIATFIDLLIMATYAIWVSFVIEAMSLGGPFWLLFLLPLYFYSFVQELLFHGQTAGKKMMKLKVVHSEGRNVSFTSYLLRWLLRIVDIWMLFGSIGTLSIILSKKGQRVGDIAANTIVISNRNISKLNDFRNLGKKGENVAVVYSQASLLGDSDVELIREVLAYGKENGYYGKAGKMVAQTSSIMKRRLAIETDMKPVQFLQQLLDDYYVLYR